MDPNDISIKNPQKKKEFAWMDSEDEEDGEEEDGRITWSGLTEDYIRVWTTGGTDIANDITQVRMISLDEGLVRAVVLGSP